MVTSIVIFVAAAVLTTQILVAMAAHLRAKRIDFIARQTAANVMEFASTIPYEQLDHLTTMPSSQEVLAKLAPRESAWNIETSVNDEPNGNAGNAKRIDVVVRHTKRNRAARLSTWRFPTEVSDAKQ
ncbi:hypothetical protein ACFL2H_04600 [Planctomycetota bacterium]